MRVVFFGSPAFAVPTLAALVEAPEITVVGVVTQPDRPRGRGQKVTPGPVKRYAESHGLPVLQPARLADPGVREALGALGADLGIVAAYGKILPAWLLAQPRRRSAQCACLVAAGLSRRGAGAPGDHGRRAHDRRHDHARRPRTRCRPDARPRHRADRRRRSPATHSKPCWRAPVPRCSPRCSTGCAAVRCAEADQDHAQRHLRAQDHPQRCSDGLAAPGAGPPRSDPRPPPLAPCLVHRRRPSRHRPSQRGARESRPTRRRARWWRPARTASTSPPATARSFVS